MYIFTLLVKLHCILYKFTCSQTRRADRFIRPKGQVEGPPAECCFGLQGSQDPQCSEITDCRGIVAHDIDQKLHCPFLIPK